MKILRPALFIFASALAALHAQESGIPLNSPDPSHPLPHDAVVWITWSEGDQTGALKMDGRQFEKVENLLDSVRAKVAADGELRIVLAPIGRVPPDFGKQVADALRRVGVMRIAIAMQEWQITLPVAKDAKESPPPPGSQLIINVAWSAKEDAGTVEIDGHKFTKPEEIAETLQAWTKAKPDGGRILIQADRNVLYPYLKQVMIVAGHAGAKRVTISVVDDHPVAAPQ